MQTPDAQARLPTALPQQDGPSASASKKGQADQSVSMASDKPAIAGAQLHAVGSIADISANWSAKVVVAANEQVSQRSLTR